MFILVCVMLSQSTILVGDSRANVVTRLENSSELITSERSDTTTGSRGWVIMSTVFRLKHGAAHQQC